jgi:hypothetical protein
MLHVVACCLLLALPMNILTLLLLLLLLLLSIHRLVTAAADCASPGRVLTQAANATKTTTGPRQVTSAWG